MRDNEKPKERSGAAVSLLSQLSAISASINPDRPPEKASTKRKSPPRPRKEKEPLQLARTFAWLSAVKRACSNGKGALPTGADLKSRHTWKTAKDVIVKDINFDRFENGTSIPSPETLELIDTCLRHENKPSCAGVFEVGPEGMPLWGLLDGSLPDKECTAILDAFYVYAIQRISMDADDALKKKVASVYCARKIDALFDYFGGEEANRKTSFSGYDAQDEHFRDNQIFERMVARKKFPSVGEFAALLAGVHLAESRKECRSLGRYLLDAAMFCAQDTFADYHCGEQVAVLLAARRKFTGSATIAQAEFIREMKGTELAPDEREFLVQLVDRLERTPAFEHPEREIAINAISKLYQGAKAIEML